MLRGRHSMCSAGQQWPPEPTTSSSRQTPFPHSQGPLHVCTRTTAAAPWTELGDRASCDRKNPGTGTSVGEWTLSWALGLFGLWPSLANIFISGFDVDFKGPMTFANSRAGRGYNWAHTVHLQTGGGWKGEIRHSNTKYTRAESA